MACTFAYTVQYPMFTVEGVCIQIKVYYIKWYQLYLYQTYDNQVACIDIE